MPFPWFKRKKQSENPVIQEPKKEAEKPSVRFAQYQAEQLTKKADTEELLKKLYTPYEAPKGVRGDGSSVLAMDCDQSVAPDFLSYGQNFLTPDKFRQLFSDGIVFLGYPILAEMANRAEFRRPCEVYAKQCTREWIEIKTTHNDKTKAEDKGKRIEELRQEFERLNVRKLIKDAVYQSLAYGIAHVWFHIGDENLDTAGQSVPLTIGKNGVAKGSVKGFKTIYPIWVTPNSYRAENPLQDDYYKPDLWWCQGVQVHHTRLFRVVPYEVDDILKPAFNFGGLSLTQQLKPYTHNYLRTRNSVANIVANFSKLVLQTDMAANMSAPDDGFGGGSVDASSLTGRAKLLQALSEGQDTIISDKENEDVKIISTPLSGLDALQAQSQEAQAGIAGIPLVFLFGITPKGLNASSEGEISVFYDEIKSFQQSNVRPLLQKIFELCQLNLWGEIDKELRFEFLPLEQESAKEKTDRLKVEADTDSQYVQMGAVSAQEVRERLQGEEDSQFGNVDLSGMPPERPDDVVSLLSGIGHEETAQDSAFAEDATAKQISFADSLAKKLRYKDASHAISENPNSFEMDGKNLKDVSPKAFSKVIENLSSGSLPKYRGTVKVEKPTKEDIEGASLFEHENWNPLSNSELFDKDGKILDFGANESQAEHIKHHVGQSFPIKDYLKDSGYHYSDGQWHKEFPFTDEGLEDWHEDVKLYGSKHAFLNGRHDITNYLDHENFKKTVKSDYKDSEKERQEKPDVASQVHEALPSHPRREKLKEKVQNWLKEKTPEGREKARDEIKKELKKGYSHDEIKKIMGIGKGRGGWLHGPGVGAPEHV